MVAARLASLPLLPTGVSEEEVAWAEVGGASSCLTSGDMGVKSGSASEASETGRSQVWTVAGDAKVNQRSHLHPPNTSSAGPASADETSSPQWMEPARPQPLPVGWVEPQQPQPSSLGLAGPGQQARWPSSPHRRQI